MERTGPAEDESHPIVHHELSSVQYSYSGPLPHPEILERYNKIVPGSAERILAQFESQSLHRQRIELRVVNADAFAQIFGLICGFILGLIALGGGLFIVYVGKSIAGLSAFFLTLASFVGVYIYGKRSQNAELKSKRTP